MTLAEAFRATLLADETFAGLVGTRVSPQARREGDALPAVTYRLRSRVPIPAMTADPALKPAIYRFSAWSRSHDEANVIRARIIAVLGRASGVLGGEGGVTVQTVLTEGELDHEHEHPSGMIYEQIVDLKFWHEES